MSSQLLTEMGKWIQQQWNNDEYEIAYELLWPYEALVTETQPFSIEWLRTVLTNEKELDKDFVEWVLHGSTFSVSDPEVNKVLLELLLERIESGVWNEHINKIFVDRESSSEEG